MGRFSTIIKFRVGTNHGAAVFKVQNTINGFRQSMKCSILAACVIEDMKKCFQIAKAEAGYSEARMNTAVQKVFTCPEIIELECVETKGGNVLAIVRWVTAECDRSEQTPQSHENGRKFAVAVCEYIKGYIEEMKDSEEHKWVKNIKIKCEGFEL